MAAARAFRVLQAHGQIEAKRFGRFTQKTQPLASEFALTWRRCDRTNQLPTNAFRHWQKLPKGDAEKKRAGPISGTARSDLRDSSTV
jgi:hypothetical protein